VARIRRLLSQAAEKLGLNQKLLERAQRRYKANRKRAFRAHAQQVKALERADSTRPGFFGSAEQRQTERANQEARRHAHVAYKNHLRAEYWLGVIKKLTQRIEGLETTQAHLEAQAKKARRVKINGNHATGGSKVGRLKAVAYASAAACASGKRPNFYSQLGGWDVDHCITGERYGERSDCSSWFTSVYKSAGLPDPNGEEYSGGYTGTLGAHGKVVPLSKAKAGAAILYGPFPHHHVEMYVAPGETIGHGSAPVDAGVPDLFGDGDFIVRQYT
jgi:hypothetical protein